MSLSDLTVLPFKKINTRGTVTYRCDLGDKSLVVSDVTVLDGGAVEVIDYLTGRKVRYNYSLKLPAKVKLTAIDAQHYQLNNDALSILQCGIQTVGSVRSVGELTNIIHDANTVSHIESVFHFKFKLISSNGDLSDLAGLILNDTFSVLPSYFKTTATSTITDKYDTCHIETVKLEYGNATVNNPYDSFVVSNLTEMLALEIKQGDRCYREDLNISMINVTGINNSITDWEILSSGGDGSGLTLDQVQSAIDSSLTIANNHISTVTGNPHKVTKTDVGLSNVPNVNLSEAVDANTAARHNHANKEVLNSITVAFTIDEANAISANTLKIGITPEQSAAIVINSTKVGITPEQSAAIVANTAKVGITPEQSAAIAANSAKVGITPEQSAAIIINSTKVGITPEQSAAIIINSAKVGITPEQAAAIVLNTAKVGITLQQANNINLANTHRTTVTGNPHQVTKADVGLGLVPNHDFTAEVAVNTAKVGITPEQSAAIVDSIIHGSTISGNPHHITKLDIGLSNVPDVDFTNIANLADIHRQTISGNPHQVTKAEVGLSQVPNTDFTSVVAANTAHANTVTGNPHNVTKSDVGLGNVQNIDTTNASNITTGILPSSVLPPIAITDTFTVSNEVEQLALTVQKGDIAVRTDEHKSYINTTGNNSAMSDWQELMTPTDTVLSVNGQTNTVVLLTTHIGEGTNLYYTDARVSANADVAANTANRHNHANRAVIDGSTASFTTEQAEAIIVNSSKVGISLSQVDIINDASVHISTLTGNPHQVTKVDVGLGNVPNHDFTSEVEANSAKIGITAEQAAAIVDNTAHRNTISGNPHRVTKADIGLSAVVNTDFTLDVASATTHVATIVGNPHNVTKADVGLGNVQNTDLTADVLAANNHITTITGNPHQVTKAEVGLGLVPNHDFTAEVGANTAKVGITTQQATDIILATTHVATITGNPHNVTKADVGLGNVQNIDCTNASNITTGILPSSVLPH